MAATVTALALVLHPFLAVFASAAPFPRDGLVPVCTGSGLIWIDPDGNPAAPLLPRPPTRSGLHLCCFFNGQVTALSPPAPPISVLFRISRLSPLPREAIPAGPPALDAASARGPPATG